MSQPEPADVARAFRYERTLREVIDEVTVDYPSKVITQDELTEITEKVKDRLMERVRDEGWEDEALDEALYSEIVKTLAAQNTN